MSQLHKPAEAREKELRLAIRRIERAQDEFAATKLSISAVARAAGVSASLIHNHYPAIAEAIRKAQGRTTRAQRDAKQHTLTLERDKNRRLRQQIDSLRAQVTSLASINEMLLAKIRSMNDRGNVTVVPLASSIPPGRSNRKR